MTQDGNGTFENATEEQKETLLAYLNAFLQHKAKEKLVKSLKEEQLKNYAAAVIAISYVSERLLKKARNDPEFQVILHLFHISQKEEQIHPDLQRIYEAKKSEALCKLETGLEQLRASILDKQYQNFLNVKNSSRQDKGKLCEQIWNKALANCPDLGLVERYHSLTIGIQDLRQDVFFELSPALLKLRVEKANIIEYFAFLVYKPDHRLLVEAILDPQWEKFPLKWASNLPITDIRTLFDMFKDREDISPYYVSRFEREGLTAIRELANDPIARTPISREWEGLREAIDQALLCYENGYFMAFMYTVLPVIEGILWSYSIYLDTIGETQIYVKGTNHCQIMNSNGSVIPARTVGTLMRHSPFRDYLDREFVEYFCEELYNERNPILHGRHFASVTVENAAMKLATLEYLLSLMRIFVEEKVIHRLDALRPAGVVEEMFGRLDDKQSTPSGGSCRPQD